MPSKVLDYARSTYPEISDASDRDLSLYIAKRYPEMLGLDDQFAAEVEQYKNANTNFLSDFGDSFIKGVVSDLPVALGTVAEVAVGTVSEDYAKAVSDVVDNIEEWGEEYAKESGINPDSWGTAFGSGAASLIPIFATGGTLGAVGAGAKLAQAGVYTMTGLQSFGGTYRQAKEAYEQQGFSEQEAANKAFRPALATAVIEVGVSRLGGIKAAKKGGIDLEQLASEFKRKPVKEAVGKVVESASGGSLLRRVAVGAEMEGREELGAAIGSSIVGVMSYDPDITLEEAASEALTNYVVGAGLGAGVGGPTEVYRDRKIKSVKEMADRINLRKTAPRTAEALDRRDQQSAASSVLPTGAEVPQPQATQTTTQQAEQQTSTPRITALRQKLEEESRLPDWWARFTGEQSVNEGDAPSGLRYATQQEVDDFIVDQEAQDQLRDISVNQTGSAFTVTRDGSLLGTVNSRAEANELARREALKAMPKEGQQRVEAFKTLTREYQKIERLERQYDDTLQASRLQAERRESPESREVTQEDNQVVADKLGIPVEQLKFAGVNVTPELADTIRFAPDEATAQSIVNEQSRLDADQNAQQEKLSDIQLQIDQSEQSIIDATQDFAVMSEPEVDELLDSAVRPNSIQVAELAEQKLEDPNVSNTDKRILNRLLQRKADLIESFGTVRDNDEQAEAILEDIAAIDRNIGRVLRDEIRTPEPVTAEQVDELLQAQPPRDPSPRTFKVGDTDVEIVSEIDDVRGLPNSLKGEVQKALKRINNRLGTTFGLKRIVVKNLNSGAGVASLMPYGITDSIAIDPVRFQKILDSTKLDIDKALEEELLHNLDGQALADMHSYLQSTGELGPNVPLRQFIAQQYNAIAEQMLDSEVTEVRKEYGNGFVNSAHMAMEFVRQNIQRKLTKETTERSYRNRPVISILEKISSALTRKKESKGIANHLSRVEDFLLRAYSIEAGPQKKPKAKVTNAHAEEAQAKEDIASIVDRMVRRGDLIRDSFEADEVQFKTIDKWKKDRAKTGEAKPKAWLAKAAEGSRIDAQRKPFAIKRGRGMVQSFGDFPAEFDQAAPVSNVGEELLSEITEAADVIGLSRNDIEAIRLHAEGYTYKEIAEMIKKPDGSSYSERGASNIHKQAINRVAAYGERDEFFREVLERDFNWELPASNPSEVSDRRLFSSILTKMGDFKKRLFRFFDTTGGLKMKKPSNPDEQLDLFQAKVDRDGYINSVMNEVNNLNRRLARDIKNELGKPTETDVNDMNLALKGDIQAQKRLTTEVRKTISMMRAQIDALSNYIISKGYVTGDLMAKIQDNLGVYIARSYRIFDDPDYVDNIDPEIINKANNLVERNLIKQGVNPAKAQAIAIDQVKTMLSDLQQSGAQQGMAAGKLGEKDLSLFMKKKDIAPEIRALMGEYTDPVLNYTRSVTRMANFIGNHEMLVAMRNEGLGEIFFRPEDIEGKAKAGAYKRIPDRLQPKGRKRPSEDDVNRGPYSPLAGLFTTPEVIEILDQFQNDSALYSNKFLNFIAKANVLSKSSKTILSPMTHARNAIGQIGFLLLNGHNPLAWDKWSKAAQAAASDAWGFNRDSQAYFNKMTRLGLVGEDVTAAELNKVLNEMKGQLSESNSGEELIDRTTGAMMKATKGAKNLYKNIIRIYRMSDEIGKIVGFELEREKLAPLYPDFTEDQLDQLAAERTRGGVPTYSQMPPSIQRLRTQWLFGPFLSFFYEAMRTQVNNVRYAAFEATRPGAGVAGLKYAARRLSGHLAVTAGMSLGIKLLSEAWGGVGDEEQEAMRSMLPEWERDSVMFFSRDENGKINYTNWSYNNPYSATTDPIISLLGLNGIPDSDSFGENALKKTLSLFEPFTSETIIAQAMIDIARNQNVYGGEVYSPEDTEATKIYKSITHVGGAFNPGLIDRVANRWATAVQGKTLPSGEKPVLKDEVKAELMGYRTKTLDYAEVLSKSGSRISGRLSSANRMFNKVAGSTGSTSDEEMIEAYREANEARRRVFRDLSLQVKAARLGGLSDEQIYRAYKSSNLSQADIVSALSGVYRPMPLSKSVAKRASEYGHPVPMMELGELFNEYSDLPIRDDE